MRKTGEVLNLSTKSDVWDHGETMSNNELARPHGVKSIRIRGVANGSLHQPHVGTTHATLVRP